MHECACCSGVLFKDVPRFPLKRKKNSCKNVVGGDDGKKGENLLT